MPSELRFEVRERLDSAANVLIEIDVEQVDELVKQIKSLPSILSPYLSFSPSLILQHEKLIAERLANSGLFVCLSSEILPEYREYERTSTTVVNAYVSTHSGKVPGCIWKKKSKPGMRRHRSW